jgi:hypothetical protein
MKVIIEQSASVREVFNFLMHNNALVLTMYEKWEKTPPQRKHRLSAYWDVDYRQDTGIAIPEDQIPLTEEIKAKAKNIYINQLSVFKLNEFYSR